jgi:hypothetical protein
MQCSVKWVLQQKRQEHGKRMNEECGQVTTARGLRGLAAFSIRACCSMAASYSMQKA